MNILKWLEEWYTKTCNGSWEHIHGVEIETIDNPGWSVKIDLRETAYADIRMEKVKEDYGENNWLTCHIKDGIFEGCGDSQKLETIIVIFQNCIEKNLLKQ